MTTGTMLRIIAETRDYYVAQGQPFGWDNKRQECCYLNDRTGARCAIGRYISNDAIEWLIDFATTNFDQNGDWQYIGVSDLARLKILPRAPVRFLQALQATHDDVAYAEGVSDQPERYDAREEMDQALDRLKAKVLAGEY